MKATRRFLASVRTTVLERPQAKARGPHRVRMPGFIQEEEMGLGDLIKRATYAMGMKPCGGCEKRAATLNRWMRFTR